MVSEVRVEAIHEGGMRVRARSGEHEVLTDYPLPGGEPTVGLSSLQLLLASLTSCSLNGLAFLLRRDGQKVDSLKVEASGQRSERHPTVLESIHLTFELSGSDLDTQALERYLEIAETRVCPVWVMLASGTPITRSLHLTKGCHETHDIPFGVTDWACIEPTEHAGVTGRALWRTQQFGDIRVRMVEYTPGYLADHWCVKGHVLFCLEGELHTELEDGRTFVLRPGMSYQVADQAEPHRSSTPVGAKLFIVD